MKTKPIEKGEHLTIRITPEMRENLEHIAAQTDRSISQLARYAIRDWINVHESEPGKDSIESLKAPFAGEISHGK